MKVFNFCKMMHSLGHEVFHYGPEESNPPCTELVETLSREEQVSFFGDYDYKRYEYSNVFEYGGDQPYWQEHNRRCVEAILPRLASDGKDFLCVIAGGSQKAVVDAIGDKAIAVEYGVGYGGCCTAYRAYESYSHMHKLYGTWDSTKDGYFYDAVIPNYYDLDDFPFCKEKDDYFLFIGRMISRKGISIAVETTRHVEARLILAGQGVQKLENGVLIASDGKYSGQHLEWFGHANVEQRAQLMGRAKAVFVPTTYVEPFGGVAVEAQLCGTPVITTDWGAFTETVKDGKTGFRCRTLDQFVFAAKNVGNLDPKKIRKRAVKKYSLDKVKYMFQEWFEMIHLQRKPNGWYEVQPDRKKMDWLQGF
jgi:glycosyltransferase involved in cell wall biosynthesis